MRSSSDKDHVVIDLATRRGGREPDSCDELVRRVALGDRDAFEALYDQLAGAVYGVIRAVLRNPALSEEVAQEVLLEVWRSAPRFERRMGTAKTWVLTIAHRRAIDRVRSEQSAKVRDDRHANEPTAAQPDPSSVVIDGLEADRVGAALADLTSTQRQAIELAYFGGRTQQEIATLLDVPLGTVKTRIRDGLIRLRDRLEVTP